MEDDMTDGCERDGIVLRKAQPNSLGAASGSSSESTGK